MAQKHEGRHLDNSANSKEGISIIWIKGIMGKSKTTEYAYDVIKAMKEEYANGVIKDFEMPQLVNMNTGKTIGFAVVLQLGTKYDYNEVLLSEWKERFLADEFSISVRRNQLWLTFKVRFG